MGQRYYKYVKMKMRKIHRNGFGEMQHYITYNLILCSDWVPSEWESTFLLEKAILWIEDSYFTWKQWFEVKNNLMIHIFIINMQLFMSQDVNWWARLRVIFFISCLDSHSDGTHSLMIKFDKFTNGKFLQICSDDKTNSSIFTCWLHIQAIFIFGWKMG